MGGVNGSNYDGTTLCTGNIAGAVDAGESKLRQVSFRIISIKGRFSLVLSCVGVLGGLVQVEKQKYVFR